MAAPPSPLAAQTTAPFQQIENREFALEVAAAIFTVGFGLRSFFFGDSALHRVVGVYLFALGLFMFALTVRRRRGKPSGDDSQPNIFDKLAQPKPFGIVLLAVCFLPLSYGGIFGPLVFLLIYLSSVMAMRVSNEELMQIVSKAYHPTGGLPPTPKDASKSQVKM